MGCCHCDETHLSCLEFHHLDPTQKDFQVSNRSNAWSRIALELMKCVCVCANCHRKIHDGVLDTTNLKAVTEIQLNNAIKHCI